MSPYPMAAARPKGCGKAAFSLPYSIGFSTLPDGALPALFVGPTWSISGGKAINTPTVGATELVTNGDMEAGDPVTGYTATQVGSTGASVADQRTGGVGSKSMEVTAGAANGTMYQDITLAKNAWAVESFWYKKGTSNGLTTSALTLSESPSPSDVDWTQYVVRGLNAATNLRSYLGCVTNGGTSRYDDHSYRTLAGIFSGFEAPAALVVVKATMTLAYGSPHGIFCCGNSANPTSYIGAAVTNYGAANARARMFKVVNGTYTELAVGSRGYAAGDTLEIRRTASTTFQLWWKGAQVSTDKTVSDAEITGNKYTGLLSTGGSGNSIGSFFLL